MDERRRRQYLEALDIDLWLPKGAPEWEVAEAAPQPGHRPSGIGERTPPAMSLPSVREAPPRSRPPEPPPPVAEPPKPVAPPIEAPRDWAALRDMVSACRRCRLCETRTQTVFGVGVESAPLMVIGEGPGADEDAQGEPFVGRAGKLLDQMLAAIGRSRGDNTYIGNVVKCRPPNNRDPQTDEAEACRPYLEAQIALVQPKLILAVGRVAAQRLLETDTSLSRLRGRMHQWGPSQTPLWITYHPAYLLRSPREKAKAWDDLKFVHRFLSAPA